MQGRWFTWAELMEAKVETTKKRAAKIPPRMMVAAMSFFMIAAVSIGTMWLLKQPADLPAHVESSHPDWHVSKDPDGTLYYSREEKTAEALHAPPVEPGRKEWAGVVRVTRSRSDPLEGEKVASWGEWGARKGDWLVFGDPQMVAEVMSSR